MSLEQFRAYIKGLTEKECEQHCIRTARNKQAKIRYNKKIWARMQAERQQDREWNRVVKETYWSIKAVREMLRNKL